MKSQNIEKVIKDFCATAKTDVKTTAEMDTRIISDATAAHQISKKEQSANLRPNIWRIIMKNKMTKLSAAAVIIIAAILSITILEKSVTPAYAIEQTIEAGQVKMCVISIFTSLQWIAILHSKKPGWNMTMTDRLKIFESIGTINHLEIWWRFGKKVELNTGQRKRRR
jgi:hypothetical protein